MVLQDDEGEAEAIPGRLPDDVFNFDKGASRTVPRDYQVELVRALATAVSSARGGKRLRITVATGGGKTRIANDWIWEHARPAGRRVLWVTKDWSLLRQAASDLCQRRAGAARRLAYVGSKGAHLLGALAERTNADVVYTTIHTWRARKDTSFASSSFDTIIIDESHWGEGKRAYRDLHEAYGDVAVFIGLTATPREETRFTLVGRVYDYPTLADLGWLARPIHDAPIRTGIAWSPHRSTSHGDFDRASLSRLARSSRRNALIVETYVKGRERYGKTLIFACDIEHATQLAENLVESGVSACALHSAMTLQDQQGVIARFTDGRLRVLVNVAMMTHGIDIPDIETVFLARPTASATLFAQMVGRAVRKTETKTHFRLVDFVDNLGAHGDILVSPRDHFGELGHGRRGAYRPAPARATHGYTRVRFEHVPSVAGYEDIVGFDMQPDQTFGIEFELTRDGFQSGQQPRDWRKVATELLAAIRAPKARKPLVDYHAAEKQQTVWNVEYDGSCGWEVTSRVLSGHAGFFEVMDVCRDLAPVATGLGLKVTPRTGTHVHLGWNADFRSLRRLMELVAHFEPALYSLVAPSRSRTIYSQPIRKHLRALLGLPTLHGWQVHFSDRDRRYLNVNPANLFGDGLGTVEVRLHSGTLEGPKILGWLSLWMRILDVARGKRALPVGTIRVRDLPLMAGPQGDIAALAEEVGANRELSAHLRRRRAVVHEHWVRDPTHGARASDVAAAWT